MVDPKEKSHSINASALADEAPPAKAKDFAEFMEDATLFTQLTVNFAFLIPVVLGLSASLWLLAILATKALARELGAMK